MISSRYWRCFVIILYDCAISEEVNEARKQMFSQKAIPMDGLPPIPAALLVCSTGLVEHTKRAVYQAGHVWAQIFVAVPKLPSPGELGWLETNHGGWEVKLTHCPRLLMHVVNFLGVDAKRTAAGGSVKPSSVFYSILVCFCVPKWLDGLFFAHPAT